jgi:GTP pyrophosphokinase
MSRERLPIRCPEDPLAKWKKTFNRESLPQLDPRVVECSDRLQEKISGWSHEDQCRVRLAEYVLWYAISGQVRHDGTPTETHSYEIVQMAIEHGGVADDAIVGLLHDTVEDSDGKVTLHHINTLFGEKIRDSVNGLSKVRTRKLKLDSLVDTHVKIYGLLDKNPSAAGIKVLDRMHFMKTREFMSKTTRMEKAEETLQLYVPLATGLGMHKEARLLASAALTDIGLFTENIIKLSQPVEAYERIRNKFSATLNGLDKKWCIAEADEVRIPDLYDAYKAVEGKLDRISLAQVPVYVPIVIPADEVNLNQPDEWIGKAQAILHHFFDIKLIPRQVIDQFNQKIQEETSGIRLNFYDRNIPVRIILLREDEDFRRRTGVFDINSPDKSKKLMAYEKVTSLQRTYRAISRPGNKVQTLEDAADFLLKGTKTIILPNNKPLDIPADATVIDAKLLIPWQKVNTEAVAAKVNGVYRKFNYVIPDHSNLKMYYENEVSSDDTFDPQLHIPPFGAEWLKYAKTPQARREIKTMLKSALRKPELREEVAYSLFERGYEVVSSMYSQLAREQGMTVVKLLLPVNVIKDLYITDNIKYGRFSWSDDAQLNNFLIHVGLEDANYKPDNGRTSYIWSIAQELVDIQKNIQTVEIDIPNRTGSLSRLLGVLSAAKIGVASFLLDNKSTPSSGTAKITLTPNNYERFLKLGGQNWLQSFFRN